MRPPPALRHGPWYCGMAMCRQMQSRLLMEVDMVHLCSRRQELGWSTAPPIRGTAGPCCTGRPQQRSSLTIISAPE